MTIARPKDEIYAFWRQFGNLAGVMENVHSVSTEGDITRWTLRGPGSDITLRTRITEDRPGDVIAWASTDGSDIETTGRVLFRDAPGNRGTEVTALIAYMPPMGALGRVVAKLFQADPAIQGRRDLKRLKMFLETGEIATPLTADRRPDPCAHSHGTASTTSASRRCPIRRSSTPRCDHPSHLDRDLRV